MVGRKFKPLTLTSITSITSHSCYTDAHAKLSKQHKSTIRCINPTLNPVDRSFLFTSLSSQIILTLEQKKKSVEYMSAGWFRVCNSSKDVERGGKKKKKKNLSRYLTHSVTEHSDLFHFPICGFHRKASTAAVSATCTFLTPSCLN